MARQGAEARIAKDVSEALRGPGAGESVLVTGGVCEVLGVFW